MRGSLLVGGVLVAILTTGCATGTEPRPAAAPERFTGFAGVVEETGNILAIAVLDERVRMFVCDNADEVWLEGSAAKDGMVTLRVSGAKQRVGFFNTQQGVGTFWIGGKLRSFKAAPVDKPAGLYRAQSANRNLVGGWVVLPNGDQVGAVTLNGVNQPAPRIDPGSKSVTVDGEQVPLKSGEQQLAGDG
jgi:serine/threonine-protein kinase